MIFFFKIALQWHKEQLIKFWGDLDYHGDSPNRESRKMGVMSCLGHWRRSGLSGLVYLFSYLFIRRTMRACISQGMWWEIEGVIEGVRWVHEGVIQLEYAEWRCYSRTMLSVWGCYSRSMLSVWGCYSISMLSVWGCYSISMLSVWGSYSRSMLSVWGILRYKGSCSRSILRV